MLAMAKKAPTHVPVSERALIARINRKIADDDLILKRTRNARAELDLGRHYTINFRVNFVADKHIDLEGYGRELGVLKPYEALSDA
jgi:hypothetical protein